MGPAGTCCPGVELGEGLCVTTTELGGCLSTSPPGTNGTIGTVGWFGDSMGWGDGLLGTTGTLGLGLRSVGASGCGEGIEPGGGVLATV